MGWGLYKSAAHCENPQAAHWVVFFIVEKVTSSWGPGQPQLHSLVALKQLWSLVQAWVCGVWLTNSVSVSPDSKREWQPQNCEQRLWVNVSTTLYVSCDRHSWGWRSTSQSMQGPLSRAEVRDDFSRLNCLSLDPSTKLVPLHLLQLN
jgi:hypothetical protein